MGATTVSLTVKNPAGGENAYTGKFLVDSGATFTVVPATELKKLGIKPKRTIMINLADGRVLEREVGDAIYKYDGIEAASPVMFGKKGDSELLGIVTLESLGLSLDPLRRKLYQATLRG
ncbi:hypothetical protein A2803_01770 [Candidatus Woesebacteria bacterium RIFCSPHIGHO2_01_FULL_44_21]|uniref:Aspartyl protease n=1 Tax=Candidatus Woesebacteria bacterium RIFCSPHIGHO2_01_FULL_44_21 TaxID=1802503 RepID=A0A1F7YV25_9BACT|nr:MAG: hypothetical protein A2803_01770 [Candidatus Woesebacteria bacterium RIFCSPHIGHO2_01_FULL_44_21]OGM69600.1 MAG: hypothetical protein A2897_03285 [Candidatus Woesebacteria bacterium RIFCSPLOWO2_01_FULL_44_24b]